MTESFKIDFEENFSADAISVSELSAQIKAEIEGVFGRVKIRGEIGRVARPASGHVYLDLKDEKAVLAAVIWKGQLASLSNQPEEGLEVICEGRLTTFGAQSRYQLIIESLMPAGKGALMALVEERRKKFAAQGLFDEAHKLPLPFLPARIGVITSPSGAVIHDILHRLEERFGCEVLLWGVQVQGKKCGAEVSAAIKGLNRLEKKQKPDLIIIARGGGSVEDLQGFNEELVIKAAWASTIPIISAIGHETDHTLLDLVADFRAPTPTAAAEISVPVKLELEAQLQNVILRKKRALLNKIEASTTRLADNKERFLRAPEFIYNLQQRTDDLTRHLPSALKTYLSLSQEKLARNNLLLLIKNLLQQKKHAKVHLAELLKVLSYQNVLARGFALVRDKDDRPIQSAKATKIGQHLKIEFTDNEKIDVERIQKTTQKGFFDE